MVILVVSNITLALLYMIKNVDIRFGVSTMGAIEVYEDDGFTQLTSIEFSNFTDPTGDSRIAYFFINNTGNLPVYVYWNLTSVDPWSLNVGGDYYYHSESGKEKFLFYICNATSPFALWYPNTESMFLDVDEGAEFYFRLDHTGLVNSAEKSSLTVNFFARDA